MYDGQISGWQQVKGVSQSIFCCSTMAQMDFPISDSVIALLKSASVLPFRTINTLSPSLNTALSCIEEQYRKEHSIMMQCVSNLRDAWLGMRRNLHSDQLDATADLTHTGASSGLHSASDADYVEVAACVGHAKCIREAELPIDTLDARMQELKAQLASSAVSLAQVASHCSPSPAPSFSFDAFIGSKNPSFLKCASAVDNGMRRRDSKFLRHIFDHYKDGAAGLPVSNLALALNDADAPVIPDSKASSGAIALFDGTSNGHMEFSEFVRSVDMPDELALYFQEKRQPLLADAVRAHVGRGSDQLFRASQLSPSDIQSAYSAVCLSLPKQTESLFEDLRSSFTAQFEIQAATAAAASKFNVVKMACGGVANFHEGLTGRIGMPHLKFKDAMRQEHCDKAGYNVSFTTGNYKITTTPKQEWLYIAGDETGQQAPCPDMGHDRRIRLISELMNLQLAIDAKLTEVEMLAIVLYTGPMFQVSQQCSQSKLAAGICIDTCVRFTTAFCVASLPTSFNCSTTETICTQPPFLCSYQRFRRFLDAPASQRVRCCFVVWAGLSISPINFTLLTSKGAAATWTGA